MIIELPRRGVRTRRYEPPVMAVSLDTSSPVDVVRLRVDILLTPLTLVDAARQGAAVIRLTPSKSL
jgi:hypothetical protein